MSLKSLKSVHDDIRAINALPYIEFHNDLVKIQEINIEIKTKIAVLKRNNRTSLMVTL
jgi:hypothetical protein